MAFFLAKKYFLLYIYLLKELPILQCLQVHKEAIIVHTYQKQSDGIHGGLKFEKYWNKLNQQRIQPTTTKIFFEKYFCWIYCPSRPFLISYFDLSVFQNWSTLKWNSIIFCLVALNCNLQRKWIYSLAFCPIYIKNFSHSKHFFSDFTVGGIKIWSGKKMTISSNYPIPCSALEIPYFWNIFGI